MFQAGASLESALIGIVRGSAPLMAQLRAVQTLRLDSWCIGAGVIRNLVWDTIQGRTNIHLDSDVDVAYFEPTDLSETRERSLQERLTRALPEVPWEVTNQAAVHLWFARYFGHAVGPVESLEAAIATWPEYATSVGVTLTDTNALRVIAPHGLDDLFSMTVRRNPTRVSVQTYRTRCATKQYRLRWPAVTVVDE